MTTAAAAEPDKACFTAAASVSEKGPTASPPSPQILETPQPSTPQKWNSPPRNVPRVIMCLWSFIIMGLNDAAYGPLIPSLETYYSLSYLVVSLIFFSPLVGYIASALVLDRIHHRLGQRGVVVLASVCRVVAYLVVSLHPPYPALIVAYMLAGLANGLVDGAWNAWFGTLENSTQLLGILNGVFAFGAVASPFVATSMIVKGNLPWYTFYYVLLGASSLELIIAVPSFWSATGAVYRASVSSTTDESQSSSSSRVYLYKALACRPYARITWLCALSFMILLGTQISVGGWIVVFMIRIRNGAEFASGMTATGFWLGIAIARSVAGFITPVIGEWRIVMIAVPTLFALQLVFWLVPQFYVSAVAVSLQGFFFGPIFPATIVALNTLLPPQLHVSAISFAIAIGGTGSSLIPFAVGAIAQAKGVQVLQPIILAMLVTLLLVWLCLPRFRSGKLEHTDDDNGRVIT